MALKSQNLPARIPRALTLSAFALLLSSMPGFVVAQSAGGAVEPEFVLLGTSRIGNRVSATLQLRSGKQVTVVSRNGSSVPLSGFSGYTVTSIEPRRVSIRHPGDLRCEAFPEQGVVCDGEHVTALELRVRVQDRIADPEAGRAVFRDANDLTDVLATPGSFIEQIQNKAAEKGERPEVPEGMELIETPSGFQLVPED